MESKIKQKKWFAAIGVALALLMAAVGIPVGISASAAETAEIQPTGMCCDEYGVYTESYLTAVAYHYNGHTADCMQYEQSTYIHLGLNMNPSYGYVTKSGHSYTEVMIPEIGSNATVSPYYWMRPSTSSDASYYQGHYVINAAEGSGLIVSGRLVTGTVVANAISSFAIPSNWKEIEGSCVYNGAIGEFKITKNQRRTEIELYIDEDDEPDIMFDISVSNGLLKIISDKTFDCTDLVVAGSQEGALAFHIET